MKAHKPPLLTVHMSASTSHLIRASVTGLILSALFFAFVGSPLLHPALHGHKPSDCVHDAESSNRSESSHQDRGTHGRPSHHCNHSGADKGCAICSFLAYVQNFVPATLLDVSPHLASVTESLIWDFSPLCSQIRGWVSPRAPPFFIS